MTAQHRCLGTALASPRTRGFHPYRRGPVHAMVALACCALLVASCGGGAETGDAGSAGGPRAGTHDARDDTGLAVADPRSSPTDPGPQGRVAQFVVECGFAQAAPHDPIAHPGHAGGSHLHVFFGARDVGASSTARDLAAGPTTCDQRLDRAAYWAPALLDGGEIVRPRRAIAYYRPGVGVDPATVEPYPFGLAMIGGDAAATATQPIGVAAWSCGTGSARTPTPRPCPPERPLRMLVSFPDCWDGERLDSPDHTSHMARSDEGACPASHPVAVPQLLLAIDYPVTGSDRDLSLASGPLLSAHADFLNAWEPTKLRTEVESCLHRAVTCDVASNRGL